jgi:hypothetical protein
MALPKPRPDSSRSDPDWHALYEIEDAHDVDTYVEAYPTAAAILLEAPPQIRAIFGESSLPRLAVQHDPEDGDCWLTVSIPAEAEDETMLPLIYALEDRWWLDRMQSTDAVIVFDVVQR